MQFRFHLRSYSDLISCCQTLDKYDIPWRDTLTELNEKPDHQSGKENSSSGRAQLGDELSEVIQLQLEGRILRVPTQGCACKPKR